MCSDFEASAAEGDGVTDAGVELIAQHPSNHGTLKHLRFSQITADGVVHLKTLSNLRDLNLDYTGIGDEELQALSSLSKLDQLNVGATSVTPAGVAAFHKALPNCTVNTTFYHDRRVAEWALSIGGNIKVITAADTISISDSGELPIDDFAVVELELHGNKVTHEGFKQTDGLRLIKTVNLRNTPLSNASIEWIRRLPA